MASSSGTSETGFLTRIWSLLVSVWSEEGCIADPNGLAVQSTCAPAPADPSGAGCIIDPSGACAPAPAAETLDAGCIADPDGLR